jgi:hypothetical protein
MNAMTQRGGSAPDDWATRELHGKMPLAASAKTCFDHQQ